jgi:hypothetical protein
MMQYFLIQFVSMLITNEWSLKDTYPSLQQVPAGKKEQ